jgi:hypothetical protein
MELAHANRIVVCARPSESPTEELCFTVGGDPKVKHIPLALLSPKFDANLRWFMERYAVHDPFDSPRAIGASQSLVKYTSSLRQAVFDNLEPYLEKFAQLRLIVQDDDSQSRLHSLHWEVLENTPDEKSVLVVGREVKPLVEPRRTDNVIKIGLKGFNMCLVTSRPEAMAVDAQEDSDHRSVSRALIESLNSPLFNLHVVRPGTYEALEDYLRLSNAQERPIHLVHLDVHGVVKRVKNIMVYSVLSVVSFCSDFL